ncbi:protein big brother-like [Linepithema humile]|uniref:protein big brother-like n=1 Tax=Linepithema humile TaxID=83485 RepID=UPI000623461F|nr:PREDICTED: protein big brother-like [Linepithema humile]
MMHAMSEHPGVGVLPFDGMGLYEQPRPTRLVFKMPRVVPDQKSKFESDELFRRLSRESEVRYTGYRDRPMEERQVRFTNGCREGHTEIAFAATGTNLQLVFGNASGNYAVDPCDCDFDKEHGKVHLRSHLIMNGVCVRWRGWIDLERLDGVGCLEYDEERAAEEDVLLRDQIERYNQRIRDFDEKQRAYRSGAAAAAAQPPHLNHHYHHDTHHAASHHHHHHGHHSRHVGGAGATGATATGIEPHLPHRQDPEIEVRLRAY